MHLQMEGRHADAISPESIGWGGGWGGRGVVVKSLSIFFFKLYILKHLKEYSLFFCC